MAEETVGGVFISYRRLDSAHAARLHQALEARLEGVPIFFDRSEIAPGSPFPDALRRELDECAVCIVLIGPEWLGAQNSYHQRRLDLDDDWVAQEVGRVLERGILVIPVLAGGEPLPVRQALPDRLKPLVDRNAVALRDDVYQFQVGVLVTEILKVVEGAVEINASTAGVAIGPVELRRIVREEVTAALTAASAGDSAIRVDVGKGSGPTGRRFKNDLIEVVPLDNSQVVSPADVEALHGYVQELLGLSADSFVDSIPGLGGVGLRHQVATSTGTWTIFSRSSTNHFGHGRDVEVYRGNVAIRPDHDGNVDGVAVLANVVKDLEKGAWMHFSDPIIAVGEPIGQIQDAPTRRP